MTTSSAPWPDARAKAPIAFGLCLVENGFDETAHAEAALPADFEPVEERVLVKAKEWLARLPFHEADLLIIDEIGKEISGSGMDTNVVGRKRALKSQTLGEPAEHAVHLHPRSLGPHPRQRRRRRLRRFHHHPARQEHELQGDRHQLHHLRLPRGARTCRSTTTPIAKCSTPRCRSSARAKAEARIIHIKNTLMLAEVEVSSPA